jgi:pSer/pThr/pTyr-binding forkhead associated (FHA) protein
MLRAKNMGFKSVRRVEVKAETTCPGETRTITDPTGTRVTTTRIRRTLPKMEFMIEEDGAILHGPQRSSFAVAAAAAAAAASASSSNATTMQILNLGHRNDGQRGNNQLLLNERQENDKDDQEEEEEEEDVVFFENKKASKENPPMMSGLGSGVHGMMKECVLHDTRASTLAVKYDTCMNKFVCGSSIERFSGHTGVCRVLGSKKYPIVPHGLQLGDLLRIGSVGLVVCEINRTTKEETQETLCEEEFQYLRENYLSLPLQQIGSTTRTTSYHHERINTPNSNHEESEESEESDQYKQQPLINTTTTTNHFTTRRHKCGGLHFGETSDKADSSEEDGQNSNSLQDEDEEEEDGDENHGKMNSQKEYKKKPQDQIDSDESFSESSSSFFYTNTTKQMMKLCYICYDGEEEPETNPLVAPCHCKGDTKYVHLECLQRWNHNVNENENVVNQAHKVCAITNIDGLDVCSICKATYLTSVELEDGRVISLLAKKLPPPYVTFAVVTQHETPSLPPIATTTRNNHRSITTLTTNTRFQLSFANLPHGQNCMTIGRSTSNHMTLKYRTVSQLHAKIKFQNEQFYLFDAGSSNGTMLFLREPLALEWNKSMHVKIGRTILTLKARKKWKWSGSGSGSGSGNNTGENYSDSDCSSATASPVVTHRSNSLFDSPMDSSGSFFLHRPITIVVWRVVIISAVVKMQAIIVDHHPLMGRHLFQ